MTTKLIIPLVAALLLLPSCSDCRKPCSNRPCAPTAPRCCPQAKPAAKPACGCKKRKTAPARCRTKQYVQKCSPNRRMVTLSNLLDYLPGIPPGYTSL